MRQRKSPLVPKRERDEEIPLALAEQLERCSDDMARRLLLKADGRQGGRRQILGVSEQFAPGEQEDK